MDFNASSSKAMVTGNFNELALEMAPAFERLGLTPADANTIREGVLAYFDPNTNPDAQALVEELSADIHQVVAIANQHQQVEGELVEVAARIHTATEELRDVADESAEELENHDARRVEIESNLRTARAEMAEESRIALMAFTNPLATTIGRYAVTGGQYIAPPVVAGMAYLNADMFTEYCSDALSGPMEMLTCGSTIGERAVYVPLAAATAITVACRYATAAAVRIREHQEAIDALETAHATEVAQHRANLAEFANRNETATTTVESENARRDELDVERVQLDNQMGLIRDAQLTGIARAQVDLLREALNEDVQGRFVVKAGTAAVKTIMRATVAGLADAQALALTAADPAPALGGSSSANGLRRRNVQKKITN